MATRILKNKIKWINVQCLHASETHSYLEILINIDVVHNPLHNIGDNKLIYSVYLQGSGKSKVTGLKFK